MQWLSKHTFGIYGINYEKKNIEMEKDHAELVQKQCLYIQRVLAGSKDSLLLDSFTPPIIPPAPVGEHKR